MSDEAATETGRLEGKAVLVTGASSGLGRATAISLARAGADVALAARSREELESAEEKASELGRRATGWVRDLIKQKGCQLWLLPPYSPDFNPIEEAFSKVKSLIRKAKSRTLDALFTATAGALGEVSEEGARAFFEDYSFKRPRGHSL